MTSKFNVTEHCTEVQERGISGIILLFRYHEKMIFKKLERQSPCSLNSELGRKTKGTPSIGRELGRTYPAGDFFIRNPVCFHYIRSPIKWQGAAIKPSSDRHPPLLTTTLHLLAVAWTLHQVKTGTALLKPSNTQSFGFVLPLHPPRGLHQPSITLGAPLGAPKPTNTTKMTRVGLAVFFIS